MRNTTLLVLFSAALLPCVGEELYAFFPAVARPQVIQKEISDALPGTDVLVFGRYSDFVAKVESDSPTAILTIPELVRQFGNFEILLSAENSGAREEALVLLSVGKQASLTQTSRHLGIVDFLGKRGTETLVKGFLRGTPKLKRVTKIEDLLPLLSFNMADAVIVTQDQADYLKTTSKLDLVTTEIPGAQLGLICLAVRKGHVPGPMLKNIRVLPIAGVEKWK